MVFVEDIFVEDIIKMLYFIFLISSEKKKEKEFA